MILISLCNKEKKEKVCMLYLEPGHEKTCIGVSKQVQHKSGFAAIENGLKFWIMIEEGLYYLCSENKEADQLRSYCAADMHLCFRICKKLVF